MLSVANPRLPFHTNPYALAPNLAGILLSPFRFLSIMRRRTSTNPSTNKPNSQLHIPICESSITNIVRRSLTTKPKIPGHLLANHKHQTTKPWPLSLSAQKLAGYKSLSRRSPQIPGYESMALCRFCRSPQTPEIRNDATPNRIHKVVACCRFFLWKWR